MDRIGTVRLSSNSVACNGPGKREVSAVFLRDESGNLEGWAGHPRVAHSLLNAEDHQPLQIPPYKGTGSETCAAAVQGRVGGANGK